MPDNHAGEDKTQSFVTISPGAVVSRYRIVEKIGAGGMGEVYLAEDSTLHRKLALKFLPQHLVSDENFRTRFLREAQAAAALNHPNIITIYEISEFEDRLYMAIEFVDGQSLAEMLEEDVPDFNTTLQIIVQVCSGLQKAHQGGIVHRDIKPGNIMVSRDGHVKILDFGLARAEQDTQLTQAGTTLGTASNMSPEQGQGLEADQRSDVFSAGTVLYELLTGHSPFKRANIPATIHAVVHEEPEPLAKYTVTVPDGMQPIIDKTLTKDRVERYQSMTDLIMDLKRLQSGMQVQQSFMSQTVLVQPAVKTLAVLYLRNLGSADDEFLCYGITEDLIVDLTRIGSMRVASMRSILKFKASDEDLQTIARQLNVNLILDGSIHKSNKAIRVSAQLVDVISGDNLWAERWEEAPENLSQIKQALAQEISRALEVDKTVVQAAQVGSPEAKNHEAYELYLRGKYAFDHKKEKNDVETALGLYQQAMAVEASFLAARSGIAEILIYKGEYEQANRELNLALSDARQWDQRADEASLLRLLARSYCLSSQWDEARQQANLALEMSKGLGDLAGEAEAIGLLIEVFLRRAKFDEALPLFQRVVQINHMLDDQDKGAEALKNMGNVHFRKGEYNRARALYERALGIA
ncbi:MAG: protein kinase domain-containing protein, partial [Planctomycetota bacterium]